MIIRSLLDNDLYNFTMMQIIHHRFPGHEAAYRFKCRSKGVDLLALEGEIRDEIASLGALSFSDTELSYLRSTGHFADDFLDHLSVFRLDPSLVRVFREGSKGGEELAIEIRGDWARAKLLDIPILSIVNELHMRRLMRDGGLDPAEVMGEAKARLEAKIALIRTYNAENPNNRLLLTNFGTRRRFSRDWSLEVDAMLKAGLGDAYLGTSCVENAMRLGIDAAGTMAHELLQAGQVLAPDLGDAQRFILDAWLSEYRGRLSIALSDVTGLHAFLDDFGDGLARAYRGFRQDSGDPLTVGREMVEHYRALGIDPSTKVGVFSDGLDVPRAIELVRELGRDLIVRPAIGTNLTNDTGLKPLSIVIKLTALDGLPVAKLSDDPGKTMCRDQDYLARLRLISDQKASSYIARRAAWRARGAS